jgi:2-oxoisovalerate dehydrogenase E1 component
MGAARLEEALLAAITALGEPGSAPRRPQGPTDVDLFSIFDAQVTSRHLDVAARDLQSMGRGFYTISSAGHESNAAVALALQPTDPAFVHYRSGAFYLARAAQVAGSSPVQDILLGLLAAVDEPIAGGRHKVFGNVALSIIPQTSTIASHLPRAVGLAVALHRARRLGLRPPAQGWGGRLTDSPLEWPQDAVVMCSFGDASVNHSTAVGAMNTALYAVARGLPMPLLLVCEDNGLGISVPTPPGWIESTYGHRPGLTYLAVDGADTADTYLVAAQAIEQVRSQRRPAFLHLKTVRFLGHAGSDVELSYRTQAQIVRDYARDPLLGTAKAMVAVGLAGPSEILTRYQELRQHVDDAIAKLTDTRTLESGAEVIRPLSPRTPDKVAHMAANLRGNTRSSPATLAESINATLSDALDRDERVIVFGEDVGHKGGVYGVTRGLARRFGSARVFDTLVDEQAILGFGLGAGLAGLLPIPEIQYLAYLHNAEDQLRGEAASLSFFSTGQYRNPLVIRIAGLGYQRGFGGHFHNDNGVAVLRDIPGLVVASPARGDDAAAMLRTCLAAAAVDGTVSVFLEPIALYHVRDLHTDGDGRWLATDTGAHVPIGRGRVYGSGSDLTIVTFANGVLMSLRVTARLADQGINARVLDLRWLCPLPIEDLLREAQLTNRVLIADETRHTAGVGEGVVTALVEAGFHGAIARVSSLDSFIPLGPAASHVVLSERDIEVAALELWRDA